jgi:hypothetical protein
MGDDVVDQPSGGLRHPPRAAGTAEPAPLAAERQQLVVAVFATAQPQDAVGQDAALEEGVGGRLTLFTSVLSVGARGITIGSEGSYDLQASGSSITATTDAVWLGGDAASEYDFGDPGGFYTSDSDNTFGGGTTGLRVSVAAGVVVMAWARASMWP